LYPDATFWRAFRERGSEWLPEHSSRVWSQEERVDHYPATRKRKEKEYRLTVLTVGGLLDPDKLLVEPLRVGHLSEQLVEFRRLFYTVSRKPLGVKGAP
jgi:hypothetical protein